MTHLRLVYLVSILVALPVLLSGCGVFSKTTTKKTNETGNFKDDVSAYRPVYAATAETAPASSGAQPSDSKPTAPKGVPAGDITSRLNVILDTIAVTNKNIRYAQGYRVQIYSGSSSADANKARDRSYAILPDVIPHIVYVQPNFRVKVGDFIDRLEAQRVFVALQTDFPSALIVPDKIEIR